MLDETIDALMDAFRLQGELDVVVGIADVGASFASYRGAGAGNVRIALFNLLTDLDAKGGHTALIRAAVSKAPNNAKLRALWGKFGPAQRELAGYGTDLPTFEKLLYTARPFADIVPFLALLASRRRAVCRIEPQPIGQSKEGFGTGFLVAPDVVLTCGHVADEFWGAESERQPRVKPADVRVRFDVEADASGVVGMGSEVRLADDFRILYSDRFALDFALFRLARSAADDPLPDGPRGHLRPTAHPFDSTVPEALAILGHPDGMPLKLSYGVVAASPPPPNRVRYAVNTLPGSSGSPVLSSQELNVVALHHAPGGQSSNQGVPCDALIRHWRTTEPKAKLTAAGLSHLVA
jgi:hypothetical protein